MLEDKLDLQWFSIDLFERIQKLDKAKNRLRAIGSQKSEPKQETIEKHIAAGDVALMELKSFLDAYFKDKKLQNSFCIYFEDIDAFWSETDTYRHMEYQQYRMNDYFEIKARVLKRAGKQIPLFPGLKNSIESSSNLIRNLKNGFRNAEEN